MGVYVHVYYILRYYVYMCGGQSAKLGNLAMAGVDLLHWGVRCWVVASSCFGFLDGT